jgi:hypothetical protein
MPSTGGMNGKRCSPKIFGLLLKSHHLLYRCWEHEATSASSFAYCHSAALVLVSPLDKVRRPSFSRVTKSRSPLAYPLYKAEAGYTIRPQNFLPNFLPSRPQTKKGQLESWPNSLNSLVGARGFEPPATCTSCSFVRKDLNRYRFCC